MRRCSEAMKRPPIAPPRPPTTGAAHSGHCNRSIFIDQSPDGSLKLLLRSTSSTGRTGFPPVLWFERVVNSAICGFWERSLMIASTERSPDVDDSIRTDQQDETNSEATPSTPIDASMVFRIQLGSPGALVERSYSLARAFGVAAACFKHAAFCFLRVDGSTMQPWAAFQSTCWVAA